MTAKFLFIKNIISYLKNKYNSAQIKQKHINNFQNFYNNKRPHSLLRYRTPDISEDELKKILDISRVQKTKYLQTEHK
ncbi:MAG: integrase core domain-containing protein [Clostridia bacterium]|nr:integrase core domain-containing protein [Clostridia bacterium]